MKANGTFLIVGYRTVCLQLCSFIQPWIMYMPLCSFVIDYILVFFNLLQTFSLLCYIKEGL